MNLSHEKSCFQKHGPLTPCLQILTLCTSPKIGAKYISESSEGKEQLARFLSRYLDVFQATIGKTGAEILKFINDKLIVVWPSLNSKSEEEIALILKVVLRAIFDFRQGLQEVSSIEGLDVMVNICFGMGDISVLHVGGVENRIEYLVVGKAYSEVLECESVLPTDNCTVISSSIYERVKDMFTCESISKISSRNNMNEQPNTPRFYTVTSFNGGRLPAPKNSPTYVQKQAFAGSNR